MSGRRSNQWCSSLLIRKLRQFRITLKFYSAQLSQCVFPVLLHCSVAIFSGLWKRRTIKPPCSLDKSCLPFRSLIWLTTCAIHVDAFEKFTVRIHEDHSFYALWPLQVLFQIQNLFLLKCRFMLEKTEQYSTIQGVLRMMSRRVGPLIFLQFTEIHMP